MNIKSIYSFLACMLAVIATGCSADDHDMGKVDVSPNDLVEGLAFTITHDATNPNIIKLQSLMPSQYSVAWEHPQGRATTSECELRIPFAGEYEVTFGVATRGGYVWSEPTKFVVDDMCADFISDPAWTMLTGGAGQSKTWRLDIAPGGETRTKFRSPIWFFTPGYNWDMLHNAQGGNYIDSDPWEASSAIDPSMAGEWYWAADYAGNSWMCEAKDYGTFTFDLKGGANLTTVNDMEGTKTGKFNMDAEKHTMSLSGIEFYPIDGRIAGIRDWNIIYLSDDYMQLLGVNGSDGICLNFVTTEYWDNWKEPEVIATLPQGWFETFNNQNLYGSWKLDEKEPFDFFTLGGERKNMTSGYAPANDLGEITLKFETPDKGYYAASTFDGSFDGSFTAVSDGTITFGGGLGSSLIAGNDIYLSASKTNTLKVLKVDFDDLGRISDIWFGKELYDYSGAPYQQIGYHFTAVLGGSDAPTYKVMFQLFDQDWSWFDAEPLYISQEGTYTMSSAPGYVNPQGIYLDIYKLLGVYPNMDVKILDIKVNGSSIAFDDAAISRGAGDDPTTARRYILNPWGDASSTPLFVTTADGTVDVTFSVTFDTGSPFVPAE